MQACPQCGKRTIKTVSKLLLGPRKLIECPNCGAKISIPFKSIWYVVVFVPLATSINRNYTGLGLVTAVSIELICILVISLYFVPLEVREEG